MPFPPLTLPRHAPHNLVADSAHLCLIHAMTERSTSHQVDSLSLGSTDIRAFPMVVERHQRAVMATDFHLRGHFPPEHERAVPSFDQLY